MTWRKPIPKGTYCVVSSLRNGTRQIHREKKVVGTGGACRRREIYRYGFSICGNDNILELGSGVSCASREYTDDAGALQGTLGLNGEKGDAARFLPP